MGVTKSQPSMKLNLCFRFLPFLLIGLGWRTSAQTFTFQCQCTYLTAPYCDVCGTTIDSRSFHGLLIKKGGVPYRWIDDPYTVRLLKTNAIQFLEQGPGGENIIVSLAQTPFSTMAAIRPHLVVTLVLTTVAVTELLLHFTVLERPMVFRR